MTQDNPYAKLGALDQKLFQETTPKPQETTNQNAAPAAHQQTPKRKAHIQAVSSTKIPQREELRASHDTMTPRHHGIMKPRNHDTTTPRNENDIFEVVRKAVKQIGKEAATHRFTLDEKNLLADIEYTYKRLGIRTSENEITRIAINYFIEDYRKNGAESILANILKRLNS
jgi:hypothetical protein